MVKRYVIEHGNGMLVDMRKGDRALVKTVSGGQVSDLTFIGFDQAMTRNVNGWRRFNEPRLVTKFDEGDVLVDGDLKPVLRIVKNNSSASHDLLFPGCWRELYSDGRRGCRDILSDFFHIERRNLPSMATMFMEVKELKIVPSPAKLGDFVELEALRDVVVGLTACPDDAECNSKPGDIEVTVKSSVASR